MNIISDGNFAMNNSSAVDLTASYQYTVVGSLAVFTNVVTLLILISNWALLKKSAFFAGMAVGDVLDGVALLGNGVNRILLAESGRSTTQVHPFYCMSHSFTPVFLAGNQLPGAMFALIGLERFFAVYYFEWYFKKWTKTLAWYCTAGAYGFCAASLGVAFLFIYFLPDDTRVPITCNTPTVLGQVYISFNYCVTIVGGTVAVVATVVAMVIFTKRKRRLIVGAKESIHVKKQWNHTRIVLCIAIMDMGLVVVPNFLLTLVNGFKAFTIANLATISLQVVSGRSCLNLVIYLVCNQEFRRAALKMIGLKRFGNEIQPISVGPAVANQSNRLKESMF